MKRVYLVHKSGERLGPYAADGQGFVYINNNWAAHTQAIKILGFTIEPATPERVTISKDAFKEIVARNPEASPGMLWELVCKFAESDAAENGEEK